jgi:hypothetical protein
MVWVAHVDGEHKPAVPSFPTTLINMFHKSVNQIGPPMAHSR